MSKIWVLISAFFISMTCCQQPPVHQPPIDPNNPQGSYVFAIGPPITTGGNPNNPHPIN